MSSSAERQPLVRQQPQAAPGAAPAPFADPAPAAALAISQDAALDASSQSVVNAYDRMLQEKERMILENIARKRSNIHAVERQLSELQLALHINVGPRRQALEHLRSLIEQQSHRIDDACTQYKKAKQEMEHWQKQMEEGQRHGPNQWQR